VEPPGCFRWVYRSDTTVPMRCDAPVAVAGSLGAIQGRAWNHAPFDWRAVEGCLEADEAEQETLKRALALRLRNSQELCG